MIASEGSLANCHWQFPPRSWDQILTAPTALTQSCCRQADNRLSPHLSLVAFAIQASGLAKCRWHFSHFAKLQDHENRCDYTEKELLFQQFGEWEVVVAEEPERVVVEAKPQKVEHYQHVGAWGFDELAELPGRCARPINPDGDE